MVAGKLYLKVFATEYIATLGIFAFECSKPKLHLGFMASDASIW